MGKEGKVVKEYLKKDVKIMLGDFDQTSIGFAEKVISHWEPDWKQKVSLSKFDLNKDRLPPDHDVYIFQDSIEHADNPSLVLKNFVSDATIKANFIFSLPIEIENPIPEHHIFWKNTNEAMNWLEKCGLEIISNESVKMNKEVDIYSTFLHPDFSELIVLARKP